MNLKCIISEGNRSLNIPTTSEPNDENLWLKNQVARLESELEEQKQREIKLKGLHSDETKFQQDIHETENKLNLSKIKELESTIQHL
jgi:hypothetical protein